MSRNKFHQKLYKEVFVMKTIMHWKQKLKKTCTHTHTHTSCMLRSIQGSWENQHANMFVIPKMTGRFVVISTKIPMTSKQKKFLKCTWSITLLSYKIFCKTALWFVNSNGKTYFGESLNKWFWSKCMSTFSRLKLGYHVSSFIKTSLGERGSYVNKVLVLQLWGREFDPLGLWHFECNWPW